jgi:hypothetical protein
VPYFGSNLVLLKIDISFNAIKIINTHTFITQSKLGHLNMAGNKLSELHKLAFVGLNKLLYLNISSNYIFYLYPNTLSSLTSLLYLDISQNSLTALDANIFQHLTYLSFIDTCACCTSPFQFDMFFHFHTIKKIITNNFYFCCITKKFETCSQQKNGLSTCTEIFGNIGIKTWTCVIFLFSLIGNLFVIVLMYKPLKIQHHPHCENNFYLTLRFNLALSDSLVCVYIFGMIVASCHYSGTYMQHDVTWRSSNVCQMLSLVIQLSTHTSKFTVLILALSQFYKLCCSGDKTNLLTTAYVKD